MIDEQKTKTQLIQELKQLRRQNNQLQKSNLFDYKKESVSDNDYKLNHAVIENSPLGISIRDPKGKLLSVNTSWKKIWGISEKTIKKYKSAQPKKLVFDNRDSYLGKWTSQIEKIYKDGGTLHIPELLLENHRSNESRWISQTFYAITDINDSVERVVILTEDITKRKQAEEELDKQKQRLDYILQGTNVGTWEWNVQTGKTTFNERWANIIGYTLKELAPISIDTWMKFAHPDDLKVSGELLEKHFEGKLDYYEVEARMRHKNGEWIWVLDRGKVATWTEDGKPLLMSGTHTDITKRKQTEDEVRKFKTISDRANYGTAIVDIEGIIIYINDCFAEMHGLTTDETIGKHLSIFHTDEQLPDVTRLNKDLIKNGSFPATKVWHKRKDGSVFPTMMNATVIFDDNNKPLYIAASAVNITELKRAEEELKNSQQRLQGLSDASFEAIFLSEKGICVDQNITAEKMFGYSLQEAIGQPGTNWIISEDRKRVINKMMSGCEEPYDVTAIRKDGTTFPAEIQGRMIDYHGNPIRVTSLRDITDRKQTQEELKKSEAKHRSLFNLSGDAIMIFRDGKFINCNKAALKLFDCPSEEEYCKLHPADISPKLQPCGTDSLSLANKQIAKALENGCNRFEWMHQDLSGKAFPAEVMLRAINLDDQPVIQAIVRDITERKLAEKELRIAHNFNDSIIYSLPGLFYIIDMEGYSFLRQNDNWQKVTGYSDEELKSMMALEFFSEGADNEKCAQKMQEVFEVGYSSMENNLLLKNGKKIPYYFTGRRVIINDKTYLTGMGIDISERKRAEEALRESEEHYRNFFDNSLVGFFRTRISDGTFIEVNPRAAEQLGLPIDQIIGKMKSVDLYQNSDQRKELLAKLKQYGELKDFETELILYDGREVTFSLSVKAYPDKDYMEGTVVDITDRQLAEIKLEKSEKRYHQLFNSLIEGVGLVDENEVIQLCNPAYASIFDEESSENMIGNNLLDYIPENQKQIIQSETDKRKQGLHSQYEIEIISAKGIKKSLLVVVNPYYNNDNCITGALGSIIDITETKRLQEQESRAQRLESAGRVAGQIAHDFNNLLAPLVAYPDFIKEALPDDLPIIKYINDMEKSANKIAEINQQLLTLSRRGHYNQEVLNLNEVIQFAIGEHGILPQTIVIETNFTKNLMNIKGGSAQISRVLSNLIHNARDSMQDVGNIIIKTENYYADNLTINYGQIPKGEYIKVTISDIGCGIPEDVRLSIFDPFFSTKSSDKRRGSGLGLSVVDTVMKDHDGFIDLKSIIGEGTSFYLYFPITRDVIDTPNENEIIGGTESILVIDDDKAQREVALMILGKLGYKATAVNSGEKAIEFVQNNPQELLLLDMIMPDGIDGTETFRQILEIYPNQKAIIVSGFAESSRVEESRRLGIELYIRKPLTMRLLASCIRKVLDKKEVAVSS
ncbi:MAG: PAS domain S-box protein [candidate division Zixibacteria bacterium]|nr:PAS domain S-box protein [candidate division Zixibacteria bacterium]